MERVAADGSLFKLIFVDLVGTVALEPSSTAGCGLDDVTIFGRDRMNPEVPDAGVDDLVGDDLHQSELTKVERLFGGDLEPVAAWEKFVGGLDDILLTLTGTKQRDADAVDDADSLADVGADDDIATVGRTTIGVVGHMAGGAMGIDR